MIEKTDDEIVERMIELAEKKYNCSQIMMMLSLDREGKEKPELVRAMSGLGDGCGFFDETCGIMTSGASVLSLYGGKGMDIEEESEKLLLMLQEYGDWFQNEIGKTYNGTKCRDIAGDLIGTPDVKEICGGIIFQANAKMKEIISAYGFTSDMK